MAFDFDHYLQTYELNSTGILPVTSNYQDRCLMFSQQNCEKSLKDLSDLSELQHVERETFGLEFRSNKDVPKKSGGRGRAEVLRQASLPASFGSGVAETSKSSIRRRNSVRFADEIGKDLTTFFTIPSRFEIDADNAAATVAGPQDNRTTAVDDDDDASPTEEATPVLFRLFFEQPDVDLNEFRRRLFLQFVCLESVQLDHGTSEARVVDHGTVRCTVKVRNIHPVKRVYAHCTDNDWKTHAEVEAEYVEEERTGPNEYDTFAFALRDPLRHHRQGDRDDKGGAFSEGAYSRKTAVVEFALCYQVNGSEYWDNNDGKNYRIVWM